MSIIQYDGFRVLYSMTDGEYYTKECMTYLAHCEKREEKKNDEDKNRTRKRERERERVRERERERERERKMKRTR